MICPNCRQDVVPLVRGVRAYCTGCGGPMPMLAGTRAVNVVGQPAKIGGGIASVFGWLVLVFGFLVALGVATLFSLVGGLTAALWTGIPITVVTLVIAVPLLLAGRGLQRSGERRERAAQEQAVHALAAQYGGVLTTRVVSRSLEISESDADALLTHLAKTTDGQVSLEVDDNGGLSYVFRDAARPAMAEGVRIEEPPRWQTPVGRPVPPQKPRIVDAELIEEVEEAPVEPARRQRR